MSGALRVWSSVIRGLPLPLIMTRPWGPPWGATPTWDEAIASSSYLPYWKVNVQFGLFLEQRFSPWGGWAPLTQVIPDWSSDPPASNSWETCNQCGCLDLPWTYPGPTKPESPGRGSGSQTYGFSRWSSGPPSLKAALLWELQMLGALLKWSESTVYVRLGMCSARVRI